MCCNIWLRSDGQMVYSVAGVLLELAIPSKSFSHFRGPGWHLPQSPDTLASFFPLLTLTQSPSGISVAMNNPHFLTIAGSSLNCHHLTGFRRRFSPSPESSSSDSPDTANQFLCLKTQTSSWCSFYFSMLSFSCF